MRVPLPAAMITTSIALMHIPSGWNFASRFARIIGLLALAAALGACSAIKLGYNNVDELAFWWLDNHIDLTDEQDPRVREDLLRLHRWHRKQELPLVADLLRSLEPVVAADIATAQACSYVPAIRERVGAVIDRAEPAAVTIALGLAPAQLMFLERKFERNNRDFTKDWIRIEPAARKEKRFDQMLDRSEMVYGKLDDAQKALMRQQLDKSQYDPSRALAERRRRQQDMLQTLRKLAGQPVGLDEARTLMRGYTQRLLQSPDASWRAYEQVMVNESCTTLAAVHNSTSPAQREAAVRRLRAWQRDLRELAAQ